VDEGISRQRYTSRYVEDLVMNVVALRVTAHYPNDSLLSRRM